MDCGWIILQVSRASGNIFVCPELLRDRAQKIESGLFDFPGEDCFRA
jgi:hypothetical protein